MSGILNTPKWISPPNGKLIKSILMLPQNTIIKAAVTWPINLYLALNSIISSNSPVKTMTNAAIRSGHKNSFSIGSKNIPIVKLINIASPPKLGIGLILIRRWSGLSVISKYRAIFRISGVSNTDAPKHINIIIQLMASPPRKFFTRLIILFYLQKDNENHYAKKLGADRFRLKLLFIV
ncbi:UDP-phosphate N-acetylglucosaminyl 1-phosphate [Listeria monocytogenes]|nr:UDP-phosphate N-acetylglucosaminyl 1-phosphate [Listeria monocytogenes]GAT37902.1 UDP-phosphate N-acetylglucosaminyl 1-phosphate [Listeria monocytogenes]GAT40131.1 UDP-phosphate N-acetylglucosaminyl 1-phosphate [Listeria monocytogenes]